MEWELFWFLSAVIFALEFSGIKVSQRFFGVRFDVIYHIVYFALIGIFAVYVFSAIGKDESLEFFTGFVVEKILSIDNIIVISMIFDFLEIPDKFKNRTLIWGIMGIIIFRIVSLYFGNILANNFSWFLYILGIILVLTGIKMILLDKHKKNLSANPVIKFLEQNFSIKKEIDSEIFWTIEEINGKKKFQLTRLFLALCTISFFDLVFALDSVSAIYSISTNNLIVYSSNIFAILGLKYLYFAISDIIKKFKYLKTSAAIILIFIGSKVFIKDIFEITKIPPLVSLLITVIILLCGYIASITRPPSKP
ncbi:MAG: TerC/Alx family metal homeostasis membrane protein [Rickettsiaceae bacterium]|nr:TerC/Alx family metal homeostasis membrane protein [Rickettsiaceae bacterium]